MIGENYLILWKVEELDDMNVAYQVNEYAPGLLLVGSDGGGEAIAYDMRTSPWPIVKVPFVGMELLLAKPVASSFQVFLMELADE